MSTRSRSTRFFTLIAALLLTVMGTLPATAQTLDDAMAAYERGDYPTAYFLFRFYAEQGHASAQFNLGLMYDNGEGVPQNHTEAARWYRRAAEQGDADAQLNLGVMYAKGEGVPQDHAEAFRWNRRAAEQGHASAQFNLGLRYDNGEGVSQDYTEALRWYRRAAEQDHTGAQFNLGFMYEDGSGVPEDFVQAHKWYNLAASRASSWDPDLREKAVRSRDRIAARLTPAQLARAQRLAREWQPRRDRSSRFTNWKTRGGARESGRASP